MLCGVGLVEGGGGCEMGQHAQMSVLSEPHRKLPNEAMSLYEFMLATHLHRRRFMQIELDDVLTQALKVRGDHTCSVVVRYGVM